MSSRYIPRISQGTSAEGVNTGEKKGLLGTLKDVVSDVWSYISNPGKAFEAIMSSVTANFDGFNGFASKMLSGGFKMVTDGIKNFIAKIFKENEGALGSGKIGRASCRERGKEVEVEYVLTEKDRKGWRK